MAEEDTLMFIEMYKSLPILWDHNHPHYTNKYKRKNALIEIGTKLNMDVLSVKKKIKSLRSYFSKEYHKVIKKTNDPEVEGNVTSSWFAYKPLLFILEGITHYELKEQMRKSFESSDLKYMEISQTDEIGEDIHITIPQIIDHDFGYPLHHKRTPKKARHEGKQDSYKFRKKTGEELLSNVNNEFTKKYNEGLKDEFSVFGEYIALKVRNLNQRNQLIAQRSIQNLLLDLELKEIEESETHSSVNHSTNLTETSSPQHMVIISE